MLKQTLCSQKICKHLFHRMMMSLASSASLASRLSLILSVTLILSTSIRLCYADIPPVFSTIDPLLTDLTAKAPAFEVDLEFEYGNNPVPSLIYLGTGTEPTVEALLEANLDLFVQKKVPWVDFAAIEGGGLLWFNSPTLLALTHTGFNYDSQYDQHTVPYLVGDSAKRFLWTINQLHSEAFTYILSKTAAEALGMTAPLAAPAAVQMRGGMQTVALAYDATTFKFNLPVDNGDPVNIRIYDYKGALSSSETVNYSGTLKSVTDLIAGKEAKIASLWKWMGTSWAVYLPGDSDGGASYATGKGFSLLSTINPGEGFWVNGNEAVTLE